MKAMDAEKAILTRQLPKTGQRGSYETGDDASYEAGWWRGTKYPNLKTRLIGKTIDDDDVVIDRATGLMWAADAGEAGGTNYTVSLLNAIAHAEALTFAGFSDWRVPNIFELFSLLNFNEENIMIPYPPFAGIHPEYSLITSTHDPNNTDYNYLIDPETAVITTYINFGAGGCLLCVRGGL